MHVLNNTDHLSTSVIFPSKIRTNQTFYSTFHNKEKNSISFLSFPSLFFVPLPPVLFFSFFFFFPSLFYLFSSLLFSSLIIIFFIFSSCFLSSLHISLSSSVPHFFLLSPSFQQRGRERPEHGLEARERRRWDDSGGVVKSEQGSALDWWLGSGIDEGAMGVQCAASGATVEESKSRGGAAWAQAWGRRQLELPTAVAWALNCSGWVGSAWGSSRLLMMAQFHNELEEERWAESEREWRKENWNWVLWLWECEVLWKLQRRCGGEREKKNWAIRADRARQRWMGAACGVWEVETKRIGWREMEVQWQRIGWCHSTVAGGYGFRRNRGIA